LSCSRGEEEEIHHLQEEETHHLQEKETHHQGRNQDTTISTSIMGITVGTTMDTTTSTKEAVVAMAEGVEAASVKAAPLGSVSSAAA
jgi:hypothetical protein